MPLGDMGYKKSFDYNKRFSYFGNVYFISTWKTDNTSTGSSANNQIKLPLESIGTYNFQVDWGDGSKNTITTYNQAEVTHTYSSIGTYTVKIKGICKGFRFNDTGDRLKLLEIKKWSNLELGNSGSYLYGCANLKITATDRLKNSTMTSMSNGFRGCTNLTCDLSKIDTSNITTMFATFAESNFNQSVSSLNTSNVTSLNAMFYANPLFNNPVNNFNTSKVTNMSSMFDTCVSFNQSVSNFNTSNVTAMEYMFIFCTNFNQSVSNFNTSNVTTMLNMFYGCTNFNQDLSNFNVEKVTNMTNMLIGATSWSRTNYDLALISWAAQNVKDGVSFKCVPSYTLGGAAEAARLHLTSVHGWTISDGGGV